jgi:hypothetical protein
MKDVPILRRVIDELTTQHLRTRRDPDELASAAVGMCETFLSILSPMLGNVGSHALLRRSLKLSERTFPCYKETRSADNDQLLRAIGECLRRQELGGAREASVALLTAFFELLATFIGERLTWQVLQEAWPDILTVPSEEMHP